MGQRISLGNSVTGVQHSVEIDNDGNGFTTVEFTPSKVENEILDSCAKLRGIQQNSKGGLRHAARVPIGLHQQWRKEWEEKYRDTWEWMTFKVMKLNSREFQNLRTGHKDSGGMKL